MEVVGEEIPSGGLWSYSSTWHLPRNQTFAGHISGGEYTEHLAMVESIVQSLCDSICDLPFGGGASIRSAFSEAVEKRAQ